MATYYAGVGGNDGNAGTSWALRKLTIQAAVNVATTAGDTIYVGPGTYRETVTMGTSGTAGNVISLIGDYTGANTSGVKGVVRITGSNDDISATRASCIIASSKNYITVRGFLIDLPSQHAIALTTCDHWVISKCHIRATGVDYCPVNMNHLSTNATISQCYMYSYSGASVKIGTVAADNSGHVITNCIMEAGPNGNSYGVLMYSVGGAVITNCTIYGAAIAGVRGLTMNVGQTVTVNNCIVFGCNTALFSDSTAKFVEDYNTIFSCATARTNVNTGANSVARPPLFDTRWFFEMVNGGRLVTPFDLASYSTLVEYNSGTGAPSTDMRGVSQVGTYREWGALEHSANYQIGGPVSIAPLGGRL